MLALLSPRYWGGHLLMLVCAAIAVGLGVWQYGAWQDHRADKARDISNASPVRLTDVMTGDSPFPGKQLGRPVTFHGSWLGHDTLFVSDRRLDHRIGYWVVTPVHVDGSDSVMPVVRGWAAKPTAAPVAGRTTVTGWLQPGEGSGIDDPNPHDDVIPEMRIPSIVEHVDADLFSGFVVTRDTEEPGLRQVSASSIPKVSGLTGLRNLLYALEWWVFAGFAVFIWARWCRDSLVVVEDEQIPSDA